MPQTNIKIIGVKEVAARLRRISNDLKNSKTPYRQVSVFLDRWVQKNFKSEGGKVGGWDDLKAGGRYTGKGKTRKFDPTAKILRDTGRLDASFKPFFSSDNAGIGSELPYAQTHDEGSEKVKQRRILMKRNEVMKDVKKILDWFVSKVLSR